MRSTLSRAVILRGVILCGGAVLASCGSVPVPEPQWYRLEVPAPSGGERPEAGVLRVGEFRLASGVSAEELVITRGPVELVPAALHRWNAPLGNLIADAVALGLFRSRLFTEVKSAFDGGSHDWLLEGRVVDFHQELTDTGWIAVVDLNVTVRGGIASSVDGRERTLFQQEFTARVPASEDAPRAGVVALSAALNDVVQQVVGRMRETGVFATSIDATPGR